MSFREQPLAWFSEPTLRPAFELALQHCCVPGRQQEGPPASREFSDQLEDTLEYSRVRETEAKKEILGFLPVKTNKVWRQYVVQTLEM